MMPRSAALLAIGPIDLSPASIDLAPDLNQSDRARVDHFLARASADATLRAYRSDWRLFTTWCDTRGYASLPASPIVTAAFLSELARDGSAHSNGRPLSKSSIGRRLAAIVFAHRAAELEPPTVQAGAAALDRVMRGIRNAKRSDRPAKKRPADSDVLRDMVRHITGSALIDYRDRALLSIGMMGAFRRSELVAIDIADVADDPRGLLVTIPFSKGDQEGKGRASRSSMVVAWSLCAITAPGWRSRASPRGPCSAVSHRTAASPKSQLVRKQWRWWSRRAQPQPAMIRHFLRPFTARRLPDRGGSPWCQFV
jgi:integrase